MNKRAVLSLLAGVLLATATNVSAWWGNNWGWNPYDPWDPRYWLEEFFGGGWGGYGGPWGYGGGPWGYRGGPWGGYGYPYHGGWGGYGYPYYGGWGGYGYPYRGAWGYAPYPAAPATAAAGTEKAGK